MNAIIPTPPTWLAFAEMERLAVAIAKSRLFGITTPEQAIVLMQIAQAEGRHPALAARDYDIIQGRPAKKAEAMHRDFLAAGGKVEWTTLTDDTADATFSHPQGGTARIIWDTDRAALAGLEKKENWKKYPRQMLRNRVVSEGVRTVWPMATSGFHLPEEMGDATSKPANDAEFNGTTIESTASDARSAINDSVPLKPAAAATPRAERKVDPTVYETPPGSTAPEKRTWAQWKDALELAVKDARTPAERGSLLARAEVAEIVRLARLGPYSPAKARIIELYEEIENRYLADPPDPPDDEGLGEVEIAGEEKAAAG